MSMIQLRVDDRLKESTDALYASLGLDTSTAIRMFLKASLEANGLPFPVRHQYPNAETLAALREADDIASGRIQAKKYASVKDAFDDALAEA